LLSKMFFPNNFFLCKIWGFHGCVYEECLLGCYAVWFL
jgi:hypothetical protein